MAGGVVALTATVSSSGAIPSGTVTFMAQGRLVGSKSLSAAGLATMSMPTSSVARAVSILAHYNGDSLFGSSTSSATQLQVLGLSSSTTLASTGTDLSPASTTGLIAIVVGAVLLLVARRPARTPRHRR
ncbi:MAG: Ig-like domain-containing protein [Actinomycetota bacterium]|nr:Ig-like domain-containing protein [Actinomycetota bacterium]